MDNLDTFLEPVEPAIEAVEPDGPIRDEHGRFAPKGVEAQPEEVAEPVPPTDKLPQEDYKALREEREKRQAAERELEAFRQQQRPIQPPPSIWEDEAEALQHTRNQAVTEATFNARLDMSEMLASQAHADDFDEMKAKFVDMMAMNPALQQQALEAKHPWEKAYQIAKNAAKMEALGAVDVGDMEAKLRTQIEAEYAAKAAPPSNLPQSLADSQSARASLSGAPGSFSFDELFKR